MAFVTDKEELKPGLIIFRRSDVQHRNYYCRVKVPNADRYKTVSLKTADVNAARTLAWDQDGEVRYAIKHNVALFNRSFAQVAKEYFVEAQARQQRGEIGLDRVNGIKTIINKHLNPYLGTTQIHLVGPESWEGYPQWRRDTGEGLIRPKLVDGKPVMRKDKDGNDKQVCRVSDSSIRFEMAIFGAIMSFAAKKRYIAISDRFAARPKLKIERRDEFTLEEYRALHTRARKWVTGASNPSSRWYRDIVYHFMLVMTNTGMRPSEARNLRWRDIAQAKDRDGREIVALFVQGKGKQRKLVAPKSVGDYLERIRVIAKATGPDDRVFTNIAGKPTSTLYKHLVKEMLKDAGLHDGPNGIPRSTYSFRHTYATFRLSEGIDVYFLAEQMGTSVQMIEDHYGHVNTIKHADRVLQGMGGWDPVEITDPLAEADAKAARGAATRLAQKAPTKKH